MKRRFAASVWPGAGAGGAANGRTDGRRAALVRLGGEEKVRTPWKVHSASSRPAAPLTVPLLLRPAIHAPACLPQCAALSASNNSVYLTCFGTVAAALRRSGQGGVGTVCRRTPARALLAHLTIPSWERNKRLAHTKKGAAACWRLLQEHTCKGGSGVPQHARPCAS